MKNKIDFNLKLVSAYWCNSVISEQDRRFEMSYERVGDLVREINQQARAILQALAISAPDEHASAYFSAGPLEDYINVVVAQKDADEAAYLVDNRLLNQYISLVWGDVAELMPLARRGQVKAEIPDIETGLQIFELKEVIGFWCKVFSSPLVEAYEGHYGSVLDKLMSQESRGGAIHDLLRSAPDDEAEGYLNETIFVLRK